MHLLHDQDPYWTNMKRLIVCCDGTWLDSDSGPMSGKSPPPSNVTRISRAIRPVSRSGVQQVVYYQAGLGSQGGFFQKLFGGIVADGLQENIRAAYGFLATNYTVGDEIFFFGFSRGAFTVRSIGGMINGVGLLTKEGLPYLADVFDDWINADNPHYRTRNANVPFPDKPSARDPRYRKMLAKNHLSRLNVPIQVVGVFETVGALGIPRIPLLEVLHLQSRSTKRYLFYDTKLNDHIINAFQALALDEHRASFVPAVWERPRGCQTNLRQVWFAGSHSNVGGGYPDQELANITLAWMMSQVQNMLDFDPDYVLQQWELNEDYYKHTRQRPRPWSFGKLYRSLSGIYVLGGRTQRTPGEYHVSAPVSGHRTSTLLRDTMEYIHPSVRTRIVKRGPGVGDEGTYHGRPLTSLYRLRPPDGASTGRRIALWEPREGDHDLHVIPESPLWGYEKELLAEDPRMNDYIVYGSSNNSGGGGGGGGGRSRGSRRSITSGRSRNRTSTARQSSLSTSPPRVRRAITNG